MSNSESGTSSRPTVIVPVKFKLGSVTDMSLFSYNKSLILLAEAKIVEEIVQLPFA